MRPLFIVFEGLDGSGTSTQSRLLGEYIRQISGTRVRLTSEPSPGPIGQMIRTGMSGRLRFSEDEKVFDRQMAYLFAADRHDHLYNEVNGILLSKGNGETVISTRYFFSSYAYHCECDADFHFIRSLNGSFPDPDAVVYLDVAVETSSARLAERTHLDRYENARKLERVKRNYDKVFADYSGPFLRVQAHLDPQELHRQIRLFIDEIGNEPR